MFFSKKKPSASYDPAVQRPALRCSICTGEQVAGFFLEKNMTDPPYDRL